MIKVIFPGFHYGSKYLIFPEKGQERELGERGKKGKEVK